MKFPLSVAWRFLKSGKGQTLLILAGIIIGISVQVFIGLLIEGLQTSLVDSTIGNSSQITVESEESYGEIEDWETKKDKIEDEVGEIRYISPTLTLPAFVDFDDNTESSVFRGFSLEEAEGIYGFEESVVEGDLPGEEEVMVGKAMGENLELQTGDTLEVFDFDGNRSEVVVSGFFDLKVASINESWVVSTLDTAQGVFERENTITALEMQIEDVFEADTLAADISTLLDDSQLEVSNWKEENEELLSGLQGQDVSSIMIQIFVVVAVVLGIASVLAISVIQRSKQIGILKAMGVNNRASSLIFLFQGLILGVIGGLLGIALGLGLSYAFMEFATGPEGEPIVEIALNYRFLAFSFLIAVAASTIAALIPARRSSKLEPIEVIRGG